MVLTLCIFFMGFPVGEFYLREVLSDNSGNVASFYQAIFKFLDIFLKRGLSGIGP